MVSLPPSTPAQSEAQLLERAWSLLEGVPDPEIPVVSIRELGILRAIRARGDALEVVITPTYSGCPAIGQIEDDVRAVLAAQQIPASVVTQLAPAWTTDWIEAPAREKLRAYGIAPPGPAAAGTANVVRFASPRTGPEEPVACPRCGSPDTTETSHFSSTACKSLHRCLSCLEPFDRFKPY